MRKLAFVLLAGFALAACGESRHDLTTEEKQNADFGALKYASAIGGTAAECSGLDSNNDGYVTCSYLPKDATTKVEILCAYGTRDGGCKEKK